MSNLFIYATVSSKSNKKMALPAAAQEGRFFILSEESTYLSYPCAEIPAVLIRRCQIFLCGPKPYAESLLRYLAF